MTTTEGQAMYCAGLYEGEGNLFTSQLKSGLSQIQLQIKMCDKEPLDRFLEYIRVGRIYGPYTNVKYDRFNNKPQWRYYCNGIEGVQYIIDTISPWLSPRRLAQIEEEVSWYWENDIPERRRTRKDKHLVH